MERLKDLVEETIGHFNEGARSVKAYTNDKTYIITKAGEPHEFWVAIEEPGFPKTKTSSLNSYFKEVFGIEAKY
jgi:hypothetical protein